MPLAHAETVELPLSSATDSVSLYTPTEKMPVVDYRFKPTRFILPAALITAGAIGTAVDGWNDFHLFTRKDSIHYNIKVDDYLEWGMLGWVFVCDLMGKEKHNFVDQLFIVALAEGLNAGFVQGLKRVVDTTRPDGARYSFPSGHTANAFLGAHVAFKEFKDSSPVLAYSGYAIAAFVAGTRVYKNRHWIADVVAGAGFGILSVELSYLIYFPIRNAIARSVNAKASDRLVVAPMLNQQGGGLYFSFRF
ncbi:phosphatase PAP2 family protein [Parabacteroides sp. PH5-16]